MKLLELPGATSRLWQIFIADSSSTTGAGLTGLAFNTASLVCYYHRDTDTTATAVTLVTMTVGTFTSSGFKEIDATNMPGWYQLCPPNAALAAGAKSVAVHLKGAANMAPLPIEVQFDQQTGDSFAVVNSATFGNAKLVRSTTPANTLDVSATGEAGLDLANLGAASGNSAAQLGVLWYGTLSAIATTSVTLPGGHNLDHEGNYAIVLLSGTNAEGKSRFLTYSGAGEVWTVDPSWTSDSETIPSGTITAMIVSAPKIPTASLPNVNTTKVSGTSQTARDLGASVLLSSGTGTGQVSLSAGLVAVSATGLDAALDSANGVETGFSIRGMWRTVSAAVLGQEAGRGTSTVTYTAAKTNAKTRITAVKDGSNNRATVTLDQT